MAKKATFVLRRLQPNKDNPLDITPAELKTIATHLQWGRESWHTDFRPPKKREHPGKLKPEEQYRYLFKNYPLLYDEKRKVYYGHLVRKYPSSDFATLNRNNTGVDSLKLVNRDVFYGNLFIFDPKTCFVIFEQNSNGFNVTSLLSFLKKNLEPELPFTIKLAPVTKDLDLKTLSEKSLKSMTLIERALPVRSKASNGSEAMLQVLHGHEDDLYRLKTEAQLKNPIKIAKEKLADFMDFFNPNTTKTTTDFRIESVEYGVEWFTGKNLSLDIENVIEMENTPELEWPERLKMKDRILDQLMEKYKALYEDYVLPS